MVYCYGCKTSVHLYCYGINTPHKIETLPNGERVLMFLCDKCKTVGPDVEKVNCFPFDFLYFFV